MLQMAQRKTLNSMMNTGVCLKFARSPNLIFKSQTRKYSNIQKNKNKKEPKKVGIIGGNKFLSQFIVGLAPEQNEITVEVKGMVRAKVNSDVNFASRNLFPSLHPTLANRGTHAANPK